MPFRYGSFLDVAKRLATPTLGEADWRTIISRSYYAVFGEVRQFIEQERGAVLPPEQTHALVLDILTAHQDIRRKILAADLRALRDARTRADYSTRTSISTGAANYAVGAATKLLSDLESIRSS